MFESFKLNSNQVITSVYCYLYRVPDAVRSANQQALAAVLPDVLPAAAELANTRLSKVVTVRADQHASLPLKDFLVIFNEGWSFIIKCEVMARKMIVGLRGVMVSQVRWFTPFHSIDNFEAFYGVMFLPPSH